MKSSKRPLDESARLRELIKEIGLPLRRLPDIIEETPEDCLLWWSQLNLDIKVTEEHFARVAKFVGIDENRLYTGNYDRDLARKRIFGDFHALPERYSENQNSFLRTSAHIMRYMVLTRGQAFADQILTSLNVSPLIYQNTDMRINLTYFADLLEALSKNGFSVQEMDTLASVIFLSLQETMLGTKFQSAENLFDVYETLATNFNYFDTNFEYQSKFVKDKYILKTVLPLDQHSQLHRNPEGVQRLMRYRHILLAWFPYLATMSPLFPKMEIVRSTSNILETEYVFSLNRTKPRSALQGL